MPRQTGVTTRQMREAPQNAYYVWPFGGSIGYGKNLARSLNRQDLTIISLERFIAGTDSYGYRGRDFVIDHACEPRFKPEFRMAILRAAACGRVIYE